MKQGFEPWSACPPTGWWVRSYSNSGIVHDSANSNSKPPRPKQKHSRARIARLSAFVASCIAIGSLSAAQSTPDDTVAVFELGAPAESTFILHGTLPIPPRVFPNGDAMDAFQIIGWDGKVVTAQAEIVSRYPSPSDGADVVEVLARVKRPAGAHVGERIQYTVLKRPHPSGVLQAD